MARRNNPGTRNRVVPAVDLSLLGEEDIAALKDQAKKQVAKEREAEARGAAIAHFVEEERRATSNLPEDELVDIYIELPEGSDRLIVDSRVYLFGRTYTVSRPKADSLSEMMARQFDHQQEIDGKAKFGQESRRLRISPRGVSQTAY